MPGWAIDVVGIFITWIAVIVAGWFVGTWMVKVFQGGRTFLHPVLRPVERACFSAVGVKEDQ